MQHGVLLALFDIPIYNAFPTTRKYSCIKVHCNASHTNARNVLVHVHTFNAFARSGTCTRAHVITCERYSHRTRLLEAFANVYHCIYVLTLISLHLHPYSYMPAFTRVHFTQPYTVYLQTCTVKCMQCIYTRVHVCNAIAP